VKGHSFQEIIHIADQEATAAERAVFKQCQDGGCDQIIRYAGCLKDFILYMRYGVRTRKTRHLNLAAFNQTHMDH
ncbi:MAG: hypothetical protein WAU91_22060, partial [Desulfatitalea sp.]